MREDGVEDRLADVLLGREVVEHRGLGHAHRVGDVLERGAVEAVRREETRGRGHVGGADVVLGGAGRYHLVGDGLPDGKDACNPLGGETRRIAVFLAHSLPTIR